MKSFIMKFVVLGLGIFASASAFADFTTLIAAVDYSLAQTAIISVLAALVGFYIIWKGGAYIVSAVKRG